jgi:hypothetical protein
MKKHLFIALTGTALFWYGCSPDGAKQREQDTASDPSTTAATQEEVHGQEVKEVKLSTPLDQTMVTQGTGIYDLKCGSCHKLTDQKLVGPGWAGVTKRRKPEWIMNMILNVDMMLEKDAEAQKMLEQCLVRMPNQNLTNEESRSVLEFMRKNDGEI